MSHIITYIRMGCNMQMWHSLPRVCRPSSVSKSRDFAARYENDCLWLFRWSVEWNISPHEKRNFVQSSSGHVISSIYYYITISATPNHFTEKEKRDLNYVTIETVVVSRVKIRVSIFLLYLYSSCGFNMNPISTAHSLNFKKNNDKKRKRL